MVVALDGATWDLVQPWMQSGVLPNISRLVTEGVSAQMRAELPPSSVPNWPAFMTGKNAGKHGCLWWLQRDEEGYLNQVPIDSGSVAGNTIWSYLSANGKKVIVVNVPVTYPVEPVNGVMISGLLTPRSAQDFIHPPELKPEIDAVVGGYQIYPEGGYARGREQVFLDSLVRNIRQHTLAAEHLLQGQDWDFFILVLGPTDEGAHKYWHYQDPDHHLHNPEDAEKYGDSIKELYIAADEAVGKITGQADEDDTVILMSDHGFGSLEAFFLPNVWLMERGYLRLKKSGATRFRRALFHAGFTPRNLYPLGKQLLSFIPKSGAIRQRLDTGRQGSNSPTRHLFLSAADIDWHHTRVVATGFLNSQIFINLRGREVEGVVDPADYEPLRDRLINELSSIQHLEDGRPHYSRIYRREELYDGPMVGNLPDLVCVPSDLRIADAGMDFRSNKIFEIDSAISGTHREEGIFVMNGPGVRRGKEIGPIRIFDFAPTIIYCLGIPIPDDMDGEVITDAFESGVIEQRPVVTISTPSTRMRQGAALSDSEEQKVKDRLRDLGYID
ncbi:MAG: hypothetical protein GTO18_13090 [Anaerolineales bacterium]|nr:hypothetical protein [Anaerolineales bacterium]